MSPVNLHGAHHEQLTEYHRRMRRRPQVVLPTSSRIVDNERDCGGAEDPQEQREKQPQRGDMAAVVGGTIRRRPSRPRAGKLELLFHTKNGAEVGT